MRNSIKKRNPVTFIIAFAFLILTACGGDTVASATGCENWAKTFEEEYNNYISALGQYSNDPTEQKCENYKKATLDYVKSLKGVLKCVPSANLAGFKANIKTLEEEIQNIDCQN